MRTLALQCQHKRCKTNAARRLRHRMGVAMRTLELHSKHKHCKTNTGRMQTFKHGYRHDDSDTDTGRCNADIGIAVQKPTLQTGTGTTMQTQTRALQCGHWQCNCRRCKTNTSTTTQTRTRLLQCGHWNLLCRNRHCKQARAQGFRHRHGRCNADIGSANIAKTDPGNSHADIGRCNADIGNAT